MTRKDAAALLSQLKNENPLVLPHGCDPRNVLWEYMANRGLELGVDNQTGDFVVFKSTDERNQEVFLARC